MHFNVVAVSANLPVKGARPAVGIASAPRHAGIPWQLRLIYRRFPEDGHTLAAEAHFSHHNVDRVSIRNQPAAICWRHHRRVAWERERCARCPAADFEGEHGRSSGDQCTHSRRHRSSSCACHMFFDLDSASFLKNANESLLRVAAMATIRTFEGHVFHIKAGCAAVYIRRLTGSACMLSCRTEFILGRSTPGMDGCDARWD